VASAIGLPICQLSATLASYAMEHLIRIYGILLRVVVIVVLFLLFLQVPLGFAAFYWPCEWAWQPFASFNPRCTTLEGGGLYPMD
jgi:hypothetical protein